MHSSVGVDDGSNFEFGVIGESKAISSAVCREVGQEEL